MGAEDWLSGEFEAYDSGEVCKYCGEDELEWFSNGVKWVLLTREGELHVCTPSADDFEVVE